MVMRSMSWPFRTEDRGTPAQLEPRLTQVAGSSPGKARKDQDEEPRVLLALRDGARICDQSAARANVFSSDHASAMPEPLRRDDVERAGATGVRPTIDTASRSGRSVGQRESSASATDSST